MKTKSKELLSEREREILSHIVNGDSDKEIAWKLSISDYTAKTHHRNIKKKLGAKNIVDLFQAHIALK